nr:uncharacterized protein LOC106015234 [Anas platyrhynchos]
MLPGWLLGQVHCFALLGPVNGPCLCLLCYRTVPLSRHCLGLCYPCFWGHSPLRTAHPHCLLTWITSWSWSGDSKQIHAAAFFLTMKRSQTSERLGNVSTTGSPGRCMGQQEGVPGLRAGNSRGKSQHPARESQVLLRSTMGPLRSFVGVEQRPLYSSRPTRPYLSLCQLEHELGEEAATTCCKHPTDLPFLLTSGTSLTTTISAPISSPRNSLVLVTTAFGQEKDSCMCKAQERLTIQLG